MSSVSRRTVMIFLACGGASAFARFAAPDLREDIYSIDLQERVPKKFDEWRELPSALVQVPLAVNGETSINQPYDQTVMRTYVDNHGRHVHLALAWGRHQRQEVKIHRPELCYPAQGFQVEKLNSIRFPINGANGQSVKGKRMIARDQSGRREAVSYWIRLGSVYSDSPWETRAYIFREGLAGRIPDGMLVRVSTRVQFDADLDAAFVLQENFAKQLVEASPSDLREFLVR